VLVKASCRIRRSGRTQPTATRAGRSRAIVDERRVQGGHPCLQRLQPRRRLGLAEWSGRPLAGPVSSWLSAVFLAGVADADTSSVEPARDRRGAEPDSDRIVGVPFVRTHGTGEVGPVRCARHVAGICQLSCWHVLLACVCDAPSHSRRSNAPAFLPDWQERRIGRPASGPLFLCSLDRLVKRGPPLLSAAGEPVSQDEPIAVRSRARRDSDGQQRDDGCHHEVPPEPCCVCAPTDRARREFACPGPRVGSLDVAEVRSDITTLLPNLRLMAATGEDSPVPARLMPRGRKSTAYSGAPCRAAPARPVMGVCFTSRCVWGAGCG
jgi:hypothetical protein